MGQHSYFFHIRIITGHEGLKTHAIYLELSIMDSLASLFPKIPWLVDLIQLLGVRTYSPGHSWLNQLYGSGFQSISVIGLFLRI